MADQTWQFRAFPAPDGEAAAVSFLNEPLRQGRGGGQCGRCAMTARWGCSGWSPAAWARARSRPGSSAEFPAPDGEAAAVSFLNEPLRQGRGEASATLRNDGTVGLLWLEPGSLGEGTEQTWQFAEFPAPDGEQAAVNFLNEPARQGPGEATYPLPKGTRSCGPLWLEPGSLGDSTLPTWQYKDFPGPAGEQAAVAFLNASPRQGAGEVSGFVRNDGSAVIFYLEPGSG